MRSSNEGHASATDCSKPERWDSSEATFSGVPRATYNERVRRLTYGNQMLYLHTTRQSGYRGRKQVPPFEDRSARSEPEDKFPCLGQKENVDIFYPSKKEQESDFLEHTCHQKHAKKKRSQNCENMPLSTKTQNFQKKLLGDRSTGHKDGDTNLSEDRIAASEERTVSQGY